MFTLQIDINMPGSKQKAPPPTKPAEPPAANPPNPPEPSPNLHLNPGLAPVRVTSKTAPPAPEVQVAPAAASLQRQYEPAPNSDAAANPSADNPEKKSRTRYIKVYHLKGGLVDYRKSKSACEKFELKHRGRIQKEISFPSEESLQEYLKSSKKDPPQAAVAAQRQVGADDEVTADEAREARAVADAAIERAPASRVQISYYTEPDTIKVLCIIKFLTASGRPFWLVKPGDAMLLVHEFIKHSPTLYVPVNQICATLDMGKERDNMKDADSQVMDKSGFGARLLLGYFDIDLEKVRSQEEETVFIESACNNLGNVLKELMTSKKYYKSLEEYISRKSDKFWKHIHNPEKGESYLEFLRACRVQVQPITWIEDHLIRSERGHIETTLALGHLQGKEKYDPDEDEE